MGERVTVHHGDSREVLKTFADASIDSVVCDPPYALVSIGKRFGSENAAPAQSGKTGAYARASAGFMGQKWDTGETAFDPLFWAEVLRVLKPGGHLIAFSGTRTYHRLACAIEDAGFEMRDMIAWLYGSGFPKSHDVSKGIDKRRDDKPEILAVTSFVADAAEARGVSRAQIDAHMGTSDMGGWWTSRLVHRCQCPKWDQWLLLKEFLGLSDDMDAEVWRLNGRKGTPGEAWDAREIVGRNENGAGNGSVVGLGSARAMETEFDITAPATDAARQWQGWGTALKPALEPIVLARKPLAGTVAANVLAHGTGALNIDASRVAMAGDDDGRWGEGTRPGGFGDVGAAKGGSEPNGRKHEAGRWPANVIHDGSEEVVGAFPETASGQMKAGTRRAAQDGPGSVCYGTYGGDATKADTPADSGSAARFFYSAKADAGDRCGSKHPTVKPVDLMAYLVRMVTPPGGVTLDPFAGSGSTGMACLREGFDCILIEREAQYVADIHRRLAHVEGADTPLFANDPGLFDGEAA